MATLFAVSLPFTYDGTTNHFATSTGGSATVAAVTSADTLTLDGNSGTGAMTVGATFTASTITVNGTNVSLVTDGTHAFNSNGLVLLAGGTIDTTGVNMAWNSFNSSFSVGTRTLTITNSTITVNGTISVPWDLANTTSLSVNATGSTINMTGGGTNPTWREANTGGSGNTWGTLNFTGSSIPVLTAGLSTFVNVGRTGTAVKGDGFNMNGGTTITGTLTLAGNTTKGVNRLLVQSSITGTQRAIVMTGGAVVISGDVDFRDIDITGSPSWTNAGSAYVGDGQGNGTLITSNITTPVSQSLNGTNVAYLTGSYLQLPGIATNYASAPSSAALQIAGDIDLQGRIAPTSWTPAVNCIVVGRRTTVGGNNKSYQLRLNTDGTLQLMLANVGNTTTSVSSSVAVGFTAGQTGWVRATWQQSGGTVQFFTAADNASVPSSWTQLGTNQSIILASIFPGTALLEVGSDTNGASSLFKGSVYRARVLNGIAGTVAFDADFTTPAAGTASYTESSANAATVSTNVTTNWSTAASWTSRVPLLQDNATLSIGGGTVTMDMPRMSANVALTGSTGGTVNRTINTEIYGNITLNSLVAWTGAFNIATCGRGSQTITSAGKTLCGALTLQHPNGTYTLQDDLTTSTQITPNNGTLTVGANNVNTPFIALAASTSTRVLNMGSKTWTLSAASGNLINVLTTGLTFNAQTSTILLSDTGATGKTFAGAGLTFNNLSISGGGAGAITFTGANTFANLPQITGGTKSLVWPGSTTTTFTNGGNFGNGANLITMTASAGSATLAFGSLVNADFLNLTNIPAATFTPAYAGLHSTNGGGNTNWNFTDFPIYASDSATTTFNVVTEENSFVGPSGDSLFTTESLNLLTTVESAITNSSATSENIQLALALSISVADNSNTTENLKCLTIDLLSISDNLITTENPIISGDKYPIVSDSSSISEALLLQDTDGVAVLQTLNIADNIQFLVAVAINLNDSLATTDSAQITKVSLVIVNDNSTVSESLNLAIGLAINLSDHITTSESLVVSLPGVALLINVSASLSISENLALVLSYLVKTTDNIQVSENLKLFNYSSSDNEVSIQVRAELNTILIASDNRINIGVRI